MIDAHYHRNGYPAYLRTPDGETPFHGIHPWQEITDKNLAFGFRLGAMFEYDFGNNLGILVDMNAEAYLDNFNGLWPKDADIDEREGYAGFPLDLRASASVGLIYHF